MHRSCCATARTCWVPICGLQISAAATPAPKLEQIDPVSGKPVKVLWVKGSGGDLGSIKRTGFATLYLDRLLQLEAQYKGVAEEDAMVALYPLVTFNNNPTAASIDTPLHGFLPFEHVDHLHPDWGIALAASANGKIKMEEFNQEFGHKLAWLPWQRPGFELGMMLRKIVQDTPGCDCVVLGGHGLFTWGGTQRECYRSTITIIDQIGQFIQRHAGEKAFGGAKVKTHDDRKRIASRRNARPPRCGQPQAALDRQLHRRRERSHLRQLGVR